MDYQKIILSGNATDDAKRQESKSGEVKFTTFSVGVSGGKERRTTFFPVTVFGKYGETVAEHVTKGRQVLVEGRIDVSEEGRFNVIADWVVFGALTAKPVDESEQDQ